MGFIGSAEIILILFTVISLLLPTGIILCVLYVIFKKRQEQLYKMGIKELESRVAKLEKEKQTEARLNALEKRIDEMKK